jgi:hypothetical protein
MPAVMMLRVTLNQMSFTSSSLPASLSDGGPNDRQSATRSNRTETSTIHVCQTVETAQDIELYPCVKKVST